MNIETTVYKDGPVAECNICGAITFVEKAMQHSEWHRRMEEDTRDARLSHLRM